MRDIIVDTRNIATCDDNRVHATTMQRRWIDNNDNSSSSSSSSSAASSMSAASSAFRDKCYTLLTDAQVFDESWLLQVERADREQLTIRQALDETRGYLLRRRIHLNLLRDSVFDQQRRQRRAVSRSRLTRRRQSPRSTPRISSFTRETLLKNLIDEENGFLHLERYADVLNRSAVKLAEIDHVITHQLLRYCSVCHRRKINGVCGDCGANDESRTSTMYELLSTKRTVTFADLCCAPGGFIDYVYLRKKWSARGYGVTLPEHLGGVRFENERVRRGRESTPILLTDVISLSRSLQRTVVVVRRTRNHAAKIGKK